MKASDAPAAGAAKVPDDIPAAIAAETPRGEGGKNVWEIDWRLVRKCPIDFPDGRMLVGALGG